jgi:ABC-type sulfate transport system substrate-binding protein
LVIDDTGGQWSGWPLVIISVADADKSIVRTGGMWPYEWDASTSQREAVANARLTTAAPDFAAAAASLIEAWDAATTGAQQIITGKSDADLQKQAMAAIAGLRAALAKAHGQ